jgi:hypothetical protein
MQTARRTPHSVGLRGGPPAQVPVHGLPGGGARLIAQQQRQSASQQIGMRRKHSELGYSSQKHS